jgi:hypothetical protein
MLSRFALALTLFAAAPAFACGSRTVALIESAIAMEQPPLFRCGSEFNEMLIRAHKKDWKGALAAYEAHLAHLGKWEAGSENAKETLAYLRRKAERQ